MHSTNSDTEVSPEAGLAYDEVSKNFSHDMPTDLSSLSIKAGEWKFDYDRLTADEIWANIRNDRRAAWCAEVFSEFKKFNVLELGPGEGYNSAGLEDAGANSVVSIEGNAENFFKCLLLKNALGLKTKFLYGDIEKFIAKTEQRFEMIFSCGILYHLIDPVQFLLNSARVSSRIYLWTMVFEEKSVAANAFEADCFSLDDKRKVSFGQREFVYHRRFYRPEILRDQKYAGGIGAYANWLTKDDLLSALQLAGYTTVHLLEDDCFGIPVINFFGERA